MNNLLAQNFDDIQKKGLPGNTLPAKVTDLIKLVLPWFFYASGFLLLIFLLMAGLQLMLSKGDPKAVQAAQSRITYAIIGFIVIFFAYFLTRLIGMIFNIPDFRGVFL